MAACPFLFAIWCFAPAQAPAASADDPQAVITSIFDGLGVKDFRFRKTKHFIIGYDTSDEFIRPHVGRLEGIHGAVSRFCEANGFTNGALGRGAHESPLLAKEGVRRTSAENADLLPIIFFDKFETFARYAQKLEMPAEGIAGFYHQSNNVAAFVNASDLPSIRAVNEQLQSMHKRLSEARAAAKDVAGRAAASAIENTIYSVSAQRDSIVEMFNRFVLQHEAAHQVLFNTGVHARGAASPQWLVEGLACQFEIPQPDPAGRRLAINPMRLADLRELMSNAANAESDSTKDAFAGARIPSRTQPVGKGNAPGEAVERLIPLRELVSGEDVFQGGRLKAAYAQSWSLVLYLHRTSPDAFREYLHKLAEREMGTQPDPDADLAEFESAFGPIDTKFEQSWTDSVTRLPTEP